MGSLRRVFRKRFAETISLRMRSTQTKLSRKAIALLAIAVCGLLLAAVWMSDGRAAVEKLVLQIVAPVGLAWVSASVALLISLRRRHWWVVGLLGSSWAILTLGGNGWCAGSLIRPLEADYLNTDPFQGPPFDALVILGGGLSEAAGGRIQLNQAGDRVVLAARLYHEGRAARLYCTGTRIESLAPGHTDPSRQARMILQQLGVADDDIVEVAGINTSDEMRHLAAALPGNSRVGLITSAWHMPRALRLARAQGLTLAPVPADFMTPLDVDQAPGPGQILMALIPNSESLSGTRTALKEYLALAVGR